MSVFRPTGPLGVNSQFTRTLGSEPLRDFKFLVAINHQVKSQGGASKTIGYTLGFTSISGFSVTTTPIAYRSGNMNTTPQMLPGQTAFNPLSLSRGLFFGDESEWNWFSELFSVNAGTNATPSNNGYYFRGDIDIFLLPHPGSDKKAAGADPNYYTPVAQWHVYNAWPQMFSLGDLNAGDNSFLVQNMTLAHEGWDFTTFG